MAVSDDLIQALSAAIEAGDFGKNDSGFYGSVPPDNVKRVIAALQASGWRLVFEPLDNPERGVYSRPTE